MGKTKSCKIANLVFRNIYETRTQRNNEGLKPRAFALVVETLHC